MKTIAIAGLNGGTGKTTTALALASFLRHKFSVLAVDLSPRSDFTYFSCREVEDTGAFDFMRGEPLEKCISRAENFDVLGADRRLSSYVSFLERPDRERMLANGIASAKKKYDYVIIDTPPTSNLFLANALVAADVVVACTRPDVSSCRALESLSLDIDFVRSTYGTHISVVGSLLTMCAYQGQQCPDQKINDADDKVCQMSRKTCIDYGFTIFPTAIRFDPNVVCSQTVFEDLFKIGGAAARDYEGFAKELLGAIRVADKRKSEEGNKTEMRK